MFCTFWRIASGKDFRQVRYERPIALRGLRAARPSDPAPRSAKASAGRCPEKSNAALAAIAPTTAKSGPGSRASPGWLSRQITEAFPWDTAPRYLLRDRDASYGSDFRCRVEAMDITEVVTAPRSPWQNPYVERVIGSIRRECLDHIVIFNERHLRRVLTSYRDYYHRSRTHLSLRKDCPDPRPVQSENRAKVIAIEEVGGLHHRYERLAA